MSDAEPSGRRSVPQQIDWSWAAEHRSVVAPAVLVIVSMAGIICWRVGWRPWLPADLFFIAVAGVIALGDLYTRRIPNRLVLPAVAVETALFGAACISSMQWAPFGRGALAAALLTVFYALFAVTGAMGAGDVKFAALVGEALGWIGWKSLFLGVLAGIVLAFVMGEVLILSRRVDRRTAVAFAPAVYLGAAVVICCAAH